MLFGAQRASISRVFAPALFHGNACIESSPHNPAASSTVWFTKVVCTLCFNSSNWLSVFGNDYFRENMDPFVAYDIIRHLNDRLTRPDLAFRFFRHSRLNLNLTHVEPTLDLLLRSMCRMGCIDSAKLVYEYMRADGFLPSSSVLDFVVSSFANSGEFKVAQDILIATAEFCCGKDEIVNPFVYNKFLSFLVGRNRIDEAVSFFTGYVLRLTSFRPDTCSFNIVIRGLCGLCRVGMMEKAFELFEIMKSFECDRDLVTYNTIINGLCRIGEVERAEELLREVQSDFEPDVVTYTSLISGNCKTGKMGNAGMLFNEMVNRGVRPNLRTFNAIIDGFGKKGEVDSALRFYQRMVGGGLQPDVVTYTSLIDGYFRLGELEQGMKLWDEMNQRKVSPNIYTFSVLIKGLCKENRLSEAQDLLRQLYMRKDIIPPSFVYNPVIDGFCKAGNVDEANAIAVEMEARGCIHDKRTYTILILGHCMKGRMIEAIKLYEKMLLVGCAPDTVTISSIVSCLRKAGMAREANEIERKARDNVRTSCSLSSETVIPDRNNVNITVAV